MEPVTANSPIKETLATSVPIPTLDQTVKIVLLATSNRMVIVYPAIVTLTDPVPLEPVTH